MAYHWRVTQQGKDLGTVQAISRKGARHSAYVQFNVPHSKRHSITVERVSDSEHPQQEKLYSGGEAAAANSIIIQTTVTK